MTGFVERFPFDQTFAGKEGNRLDRYKQLQAEGWDVTVLICYQLDQRARPQATGEGIAIISRDEP